VDGSGRLGVPPESDRVVVAEEDQEGCKSVVAVGVQDEISGRLEAQRSEGFKLTEARRSWTRA
jgi:hypothetical protein